MDQDLNMKRCPYCGEEIREEAIVCRYCNRPLPGYEDKVPPPVTAETKTSRFPRWAIIGLVAIGVFVIFAALAWFFKDDLGLSALQPCEMQSKEFVAEVESLLDDWDDAHAVASSTSRIALGPAVAEMQKIRRKAADLEAPKCAEPAKEALLQYMDSVIAGYLAFMSDEPDSTIAEHFEKAQTEMSVFLLEFVKLKFGDDEQPE